MKSYNQVIFKGFLGRDARIANVGSKKVANFSVATEYAYKNADGTNVVETTWLNVSAWEGFGICNLESLKKGTKVSGTGRLRTRKYTDNQGTEHEVTEVAVDTLDVIAEETVKKTPKNESYQPGKGNYHNEDFNEF